MNKIYIISFLVILFLIPYSYTMGAMVRGSVAGHGDQQQMGSGMMDGNQGHMGEGSGMMQNMNQMAGLMQEITRVMEGHSDDASLKKMSGLLQELSAHMKDMSKIMNDGGISEKEMDIMNKKIVQTQKRFEMMKLW